MGQCLSRQSGSASGRPMSAPAARPAPAPAPAATTRPSSGLQRMSTETSIQATMPQLSTLAHMAAFATSKEMCALMMVSNRSAKGISAWGFPESLLGQRRMAFCLWCLAGQPSGILENRGSRPASTLLASSDCRGRSNQVLRWVSVGVESTDHRGDLCCGQVSRIVEQ